MAPLFRDFSFTSLTSGLLSAFVGFSSSFAVIVQGLTAVGASPAEAASGLMMAAVAMGLAGIILSLRYRMPLSVAWTTPGAAFLATLHAPEGGFAVTVGAFMLAAALTILAGLWRPLGRLAEAIPTPLANAMLAGILVPLCLAPFRAMGVMPEIALPIFLAWAVMARISRLLAIPAAILVATVLVLRGLEPGAFALGQFWSPPVFVMPQLTLAAVAGIALPLFVLTMASQNVAGIAVLKSFGYTPKAGPLISFTGLMALLSAPFGSPGVNMAAITAALCAGPEANPDPDRRYWSAIVAGIGYAIMGLGAAIAVAVMAVAPPEVIAAVAGLALLGALAGSLAASVADPTAREASVITILITASGVSFFGIGGAFWGLLAGAALYAWDTRKLRRAAAEAEAEAAE
ncbi:benzoate/H(+) symporter BenE family transporter [Pseudodonghicola flavimaris]|uniref:Benzoate/H(+) symporter BenE family transporter n=1 Tax=Pseudodonghicola flavimaris TaxID=3050036 RepID=A0ABT7EYE1_9RHOB|nr:benzoate/H(+) symporter BenE family transporter [Pseudodonghicola flavimaris]MDK3017376.1 benzoate/H(+) symporter BenE family transporter [Pseudodonghicola flavimaris]